MIERLVLTADVRAELFEQAREGAPEEVCGVLAGERRPADGVDDGPAPADAAGDAQIARITALRPVTNVADEPRYRYDLDPAETVRRIEAVETDGFDHLGFYHSHPAGPRGPSRTDERLATWPDYVYLIVSLGEEPVIGAWRWTGESFVQLPVCVADEGSGTRGT
ncbi:MAG: desampylase [Haloferacaceae archaeon]